MGRKEEEWRKRRGDDKEQRIRKRNGADTVRFEGGRIREADKEEWERYSML